MNALTAPPGYCPVAPLREAVLATGLSFEEIARRLGWITRSGKPESTRLRRMLGVSAMVSGSGSAGGRRVYFQQTVKAENVSLICDAIGIMPRDIGL